MPARLCHRLAPSIKPMPAQQHAMRLSVIAQHGLQLRSQRYIVLRVFDDWNPLQIHMCHDSGEGLQELVALKRHIACGGKPRRNQGVPYAVHMQNRSRVRPFPIEHDMQASLCRRRACARYYVAVEICLQQIRWAQRAFIESTRGDVKAVSSTHAEVAAGCWNPAARCAPMGRRTQRFNLVRLADRGHRRCSVAIGKLQARPFYNGCLLSQDQRDRFDVVLVSPRNPLNMGAAARAMANFGFTHLSVVAPFEEHWREARSAVGAPELLEKANEFSTLAEAVADCTLVIGTGTLTYRKAEQAVVPLPQLAPRIATEFARGGRVALVFGSEKHGLTRDDLSHCHLLVEIPTDARQPSMNLGQAVAVCLYEIATRGATQSDLPLDEQPPTAASGELDRLALLIEETMTAAGYAPRAMQPANQHDLRLMLRRLRWNAKDTRRAMGLFRRVLWRLTHSGVDAKPQ